MLKKQLKFHPDLSEFRCKIGREYFDSRSINLGGKDGQKIR